MSSCEAEVDGCREDRDEGIEVCSEYGEETKEVCEETKTKRTETCEEWGEEEKKECDSWGFLSGLCIVWVTVVETVCKSYAVVEETVCKAYATVTERVCVAYETISYGGCVAGQYVKAGLCYALDVVMTVVAITAEVFFSTIGYGLDMLASWLNQIFRIPIIGSILEVIVSTVAQLIGMIVSFVLGGFLEFFGVRPEKRLRVCVIVPRGLAKDRSEWRREGLEGYNGQQAHVNATEMIIDQLQMAVDVFDEQANVRILPTNVHNQPANDRTLFQFRTPWSPREEVDSSWINWVSVPDENIEDVRCDKPSGLSDVVDYFRGSEERDFSRFDPTCVRGSIRRWIGIGTTLKIVFVRSHDGYLGCSNSAWLTDYVTVNHPHSSNQPNIDTTAHEIGHQGSLRHKKDPWDPSNLMHSSGDDPQNRPRVGQELTDGQVMILRHSKHVSFF